MNIWMMYIKQIYKSRWVKIMYLGDYNCAIFLRGKAPQENSTIIAVTSGP